MSDANSSSKVKPSKPYPEFPLTPHPKGYWCKKIRGKIHYFGKIEDPDAALKMYLEQRDALHSGRKVKEDPAAVTVKRLINDFLVHKRALVDNGELSPRTWADYKATCDFLLEKDNWRGDRLIIDIDADDFSSLRNKMAKLWGYRRLGTTIQMVRCIFKFAFDAGLLASPVRFGPGFKRPSKKSIRIHDAGKEVKMFTREEILSMLNSAKPPLRAMILLGINCGYGNEDCGCVTKSSISGEFIAFPRPKTGIPRRAHLWTETREAIQDYVANSRSNAKDPADDKLLFITKYGNSWAKDIADNTISKEMGKLLKSLKIIGHRKGFYDFRHTFRTVADETELESTCDFIMGHSSGHMREAYKHGVSDERLKKVSQHVHDWLFGAPKELQP